jgi:hypothetical protein
MTRKLFILVILLFVSTTTFAQVDTAWVRRYNGPEPGYESARAIAVDVSGNVYVTGYSPGSGSLEDYATIKYSPNGDTAWVRRYNGPGDSDDQAYAIAVDGSGNVYVTGYSDGSGTYRDYATIKYDPTGNELWVRRYNGPGSWSDIAWAIVVDDSGNVYVTGQSYGSGTSWDYATIKYDKSGNEVWVKRYNGPGNNDDVACGIAVDGSDNVYVTGYSYSSETENDYATIKYYPNGDTAWLRRYNGPANCSDGAYAIAVDDSVNVYVTGTCNSNTSDPYYATIKYYPNGDTAWVRRYRTPGGYYPQAYALAVDGCGNVYVTGYESMPGDDEDYLTIKYFSNGDTAWVRRYDGPADDQDEPSAIAVDRSSNVYVTGCSLGSGTSGDFATIKYYPSGDTAWVRRYNGPGNYWDGASAIAVDGSSNVYVTGGSSRGGGSSEEYVTIKYVQAPTTGTIAGNVRDASSQQNLQDVLIEALQESLIIGSNYSGADGNYSIPNLPAGFYNVRAQKPGYETKTYNGVQVIAGQTTTQDFNLNPSPEDTIFFDDFSSKTGDWHFEGPCTWIEENDVLWTSASGNRVFCLATTGDLSWTDYIYEVDVYGIAGVDKCIEFRVQDYRNHYYINLRSDWPNQGNDSLYFCKIVDGTCVYYESVYWPSQNNTWYHLKVEILGNHFKVFVDDNFVHEFIDGQNTFPQGKIGLGCWTGDADTCNIRFDNVLVAHRSFDFRPNPDGWKFGNSETDNDPPYNGDPIMWPKYWWQQFKYCQYPYPSWWCNLCRSSDFPDWPLFVSAFGEDQCYYNPPPGLVIYKPRAVLRWFALKSSWGGSCFGFAISSFLFFDDYLDVSSEFPGFTEVYSVPINDESRLMQNKYWIYQFGKTQQQHFNDNFNSTTPNQTLLACQAMLRATTRDDRVLDLFNNHGWGGHTVNPYKCEIDSINPEIKYLYVYDNNFPGDDSKRVLINTNTNTWSYDGQPGWGGAKHLFLMDPVSNYMTNPVMPTSIPPLDRWISEKGRTTSEYVEFYVSSTDTALFESPGGSIGYFGDSLFTTLSDGHPIIPITGQATPPIGYYLPNDAWTCQFSGLSDLTFRLSLFTDSTVLVYWRTDAKSAQTEKFRYPGNDSALLILNPDGERRFYNLDAISSAPDSEIYYSITDVSIDHADSVRYSIQPASQLKLDNYGGTKTYNLRIEIAGIDLDTVFFNEGITLDSNSSHLIVPDWRPYNDSLMILVDSGMVGSFSDTMFVENEGEYMRGDANGDGVIDISDVVYLINYLFIHGPAPVPLAAGDATCNGVVDVSDVVYLLNYLFVSGPAPGC